MGEEKEKANDTSEQDWNGQPRSIQKFVQRAAVPVDHALDEIAGPLFHSRALVTGSAFTKNARAHQRRQRQRNQTGRENGDNDCNRKFLENSAE